GVLIHLTEFGLEKRNFSKNRVVTFNDAVRGNISEEKINNFYEVIETINDLIQNRRVFNQKETAIK
ncbi:MAG: MarR family transcriptional regulator, partial [Dokdonia donghaensis]|nr:MarR family transcriptional regulator [Dokdonia donghaensis]